MGHSYVRNRTQYVAYVECECIPQEDESTKADNYIKDEDPDIDDSENNEEQNDSSIEENLASDTEPENRIEVKDSKSDCTNWHTV